MNFWELDQKMAGSQIPSQEIDYADMGKLIQKKEPEVEMPPKCKVLYVGGFSSGGRRAGLLRSSGFEVVSPEFKDSTLAVATGKITGGSKSWPAQLLHKMTFNAVDKQWSNLQKTAHQAAEGFEPDIVVGTSQGGAAAMEMIGNFPKTQLILLAPAWRVYDVKPKVRSDTIIFHGVKDHIIPFQDSVELSENSNCRLVQTGEGHALKQAQHLMVKECFEIAKRLGKYPGVQPKKQTVAGPVNPQQNLPFAGYFYGQDKTG